jgi:uncharacterized repeat protein (TIGR01451 family)
VIGVLGPRDTRVFTFSVRVDATVPQTLTGMPTVVTIADVGSTARESNYANNSDTETTPLVYADVAVMKSNGLSSVAVGETITYAITVTNRGIADAIGMRVHDPLYKGMLQPAWICSASLGSRCNQISGTGPLSTTADIAVGGTVVYYMSILVGACDGLMINRASAEAPFVPDPDPGNNVDWDIDNDGDGANLYMRADWSRLVPGEAAHVSIPISNHGPADARSVTATVRLPAGITVSNTHLSASKTGMTFDIASGVWVIGALRNGQSVTLTLDLVVSATLDVGNVLTTMLEFDSNTIGNAPWRDFTNVPVEAKIIITGPQVTTVYLPVMRR